MGRQNHISSEELLTYAEGQADLGAAERVRAHLNLGCRACADELAVWSRIVTHLEADRGEAVPEAVQQRAFAILEASPPAPTLLQRIAAVLTYDSRLVALPSPARTLVETAPSRELLFAANDIHIVLLCQQFQGHWRVAGQMLVDAANPADVESAANTQRESHSASNVETNWKVIAHSLAAQVEADTDEWNEFRLPDLSPGTYAVTLRSPQLEIALPEIELPA